MHNDVILCNSNCRNVSKWGGRERVPIVRWKSDNIVLVIKAKKTSQRAWADWVFVPPSYPPPPTVQPIRSQLLGVGGKSKNSRTSLMHSLCIKNIKKAQTSTSHSWGHWAETKQKEGGCFSLSYHRERGKKKGKWVSVLVSLQLLHTTGHRPCISHSVFPAASLHSKAITLSSVLKHQLFTENLHNDSGLSHLILMKAWRQTRRSSLHHTDNHSGCALTSM